MTERRGIAAWILASAAAACGGDGPGVGAPTGDASIAVVEEVRIGGLDGPVETTFGSVAAVAPAPDGTVYVADAQVPVVRRYDAQGVWLHDVGRSGQGPGEYGYPMGMAVGRDGRLALFDPRNARVSWFWADGAFDTSVGVGSGLFAWRTFSPTLGAEVLIQVPPEDGFEEGPDGIPRDWARVGTDGSVERLHTVPPEESDGPRYGISGRGGYFRPWTVLTLSAIAPDGSLYVARNDAYRIERLFPDGRRTELAREAAAPAPLPEERAQWEAWSEMFASRMPGARSQYFPVPERKPLIRELAVDQDGRLWVSRYTDAVFVEAPPDEVTDRAERGVPLLQWRDEPRWDVFSPEGAYLGAVVLPHRTTFMTAVGPHLWAVQSGDYREDYVVRFRMDLPD